MQEKLAKDSLKNKKEQHCVIILNDYCAMLFFFCYYCSASYVNSDEQ
ncbi:hypothetical protein RV18_GL003680 [Enterococcus termitis]|nr:hypothetical protein RV18_GL003680 [Enterococcus termitis]